MAEPVFVPKPGQVDYTDIRYLPVVNCVVFNEGKLLLVQRSHEMRAWPGKWHCIGGYLDDYRTIEEKAREELLEEVGIAPERIAHMQRYEPLLHEDEVNGKTLITIPVRAEVTGRDYVLNWEAEDAVWIDPADAQQYDLLPGFEDVLARLKQKQL